MLHFEQEIGKADAQSTQQTNIISDQIVNSQDTTNLQKNRSFLTIDVTNRTFVIISCVSLISIVLFGFFLVGLIPNAYIHITQSQSACHNPILVNSSNQLICQDFNIQTNPTLGIILKKLSPQNEHLIISGNFLFINNNQNTQINQTIRLSQYTMTDDNKVMNVVLVKYFKLQMNNHTVQNGIYSQKSELLGLKGTLLYQHNIVNSNILITVQLMNTTQKANLNLKNVSLQAKIIDPDHTKYLNHIRIAFFFKSLISFIAYVLRRRNIQKGQIVMEHSFILYLSLFLMVFNNPLVFFFPTYNKIMIFILQLSYIAFPISLVFFWLCLFEKAQKQNNIKKSQIKSNSLNWIITCMLFVFTFWMNMQSSYRHLKDYVGINKQKNISIGLIYICFFLVVICYVTITYRIINLLRKNLLLRYWRATVMSLFIIILSFAFFITSQYGLFSTNGKSIFLMLFFFNIYIYCLQFFYLKVPKIVQKIIRIENNIILSASSAVSRVNKQPFPQSQQDDIINDNKNSISQDQKKEKQMENFNEQKKLQFQTYQA